MGPQERQEEEVEVDLPQFLKGDERRFKQVLINLVKNALKFTERGSVLIVTCYRHEEKELTVQVRDTGVGIAADDLCKLFSRFGKLHRTAEMNHEGIGLGLTIVKEIVSKNNGEIAVHSKGLGHGCYFCLTLKMDTERQPTIADASFVSFNEEKSLLHSMDSVDAKPDWKEPQPRFTESKHLLRFGLEEPGEDSLVSPRQVEYGEGSSSSSIDAS